MNAEQAKLKNIINMAFGFGAMTRLFEKGSHRQIVTELGDRPPKIAHQRMSRTFRSNTILSAVGLRIILKPLSVEVRVVDW